MKIGLTIGAAAAALVAGTFAFAQDSVIEQRQAIMQSNGASLGALNRMAGGDAAFDAAAATAALETIAGNMETFPTLFPEGSDTGETRAKPEIWANKEDFEARAAKLAADATAAAASISTVEDVQAALETVGPNCGGCHGQYRM